jgi:hypothetical protein
MAAVVRIQLTRRGFLAAQLLRAHPDLNADWSDLEEAVERIAGRGETRTPAEVELLYLANLQPFHEKKFPDGGRS